MYHHQYALLTFPILLLSISAHLRLWTRNYRQILISLKNVEEMAKIASLHIQTALLDFLISSQQLETKHLNLSSIHIHIYVT